MPRVHPRRASVTAATVLLVAAVTGVSAAWALAAPGRQQAGTATTTQADAGASAGRDGSARPDLERPGRTGGPSQVRPPDRLSIAAIDVDAPVVASGVTRAGNAEIPPDGDVIGWYEYGSAPGAARGSAVLIGHRDTIAEGPGALFDLDDLSVGDAITVATGRLTYDYEVVRVQSVAKERLPDSLFTRTGPPRLVVITCGGPFDAAAGGYQENLYAVAAPSGRR